MKTALVLFAAGSEELETVSIVNLMRRAGIPVTLAGLTSGALAGSRGISLLPDTTLDAVLHDHFDLIVLPGGQPGTRHLMADARVLQLIKQMASQDKFVAAICAAPMVLAAAGLLDGKRATCYPTCLNDYPNVLVQASAIVEDGKLITSRGPGTAMDFALLLVERLAGKLKRDEVEAGLVR
ncbi:MAG TPA: DJ-1 family protein [Gallionella sp.]|jgi:4-methyl-5(b-hydroxyethyl)-thiazole monophosphate biosynthesis|nr:MAG: 4-methyl-5(B-hydroxyethyl)-thiazole monophosphate biosynthesis protein [Gallionellales bacterium GWA2_54_124]OGT19012.1 MAG: 4-methyl-5(B-hydroxyethyl)-thiazole monophosphate biosynthesis protein [Gallionellales bacterium RIFOXYD12_FULL_53_10]HCI52086.1 DJ-1 family protein [Gallionella sp.]